MKKKGWIKLWRDFFTHWVAEDKPHCSGYAWFYLVSYANYQDGVVVFRGEYINIKRGQFLTSKLKLKNEFGWGRAKLNNFLNALENDGMITYRITNRYIVITVINYEEYQSDNVQTTYKRPTGDQQATTTKKEKKEEKEKNNNIYVKNIFSYWQKKLNHKKSKLTKERATKILARLKEGYTEDDLKKAIDGCAASSYHMGQNEQGMVYDSIGLIFRNAEKVDEFISRNNTAINREVQKYIRR